MELLATQAEAISYGVSLLLKAGAILGVAWLIAACLRHQSAGLRHILWSAAVGAVLALPLLAVWVPPVEIDLSIAETVYERLVSRGDVEVPTTASGVLETTTSAGELGVSAPLLAPSTTPSDAPAASEPVATGLWILAAWLAGVVGLLGLFFFDLARIHLATRDAVANAHAQLSARAVAEHIGLDRVPQVRLGEVDMPVTWGLIRPVVLLPVEAAGWPEKRMRLVLLHEFAHIRRLDYLSHILAELACVVYWPNPLVWIARHRLRAEQERACDDLVLRTGTASYDYAELLLDIARSVGARRMLPAGISMADRSGLKARIQSILDPGVERGAVSSAALAVVLLLVAVPAFSAAALRSSDTVAVEDHPPERNLSQVDEQADDSNELAGSSALQEPYVSVIEAESGTLRRPMTQYEDPDASGGRYVMVRDQKGFDAPEGGPGQVSFQIDAGESGVRAVWARVLAPHSNDNSFYVSVDGGKELRWDAVRPGRRNHVKQWTWLPVVDRRGRALELEPGRHTITFRNREDGTALDALFVTGDPSLLPTGRTPMQATARMVAMAVEAEAPVALAAPMEIRAEDSAYGRLYVAAARGFESRRNVPEDGRLRYRIDVAEADEYVIWARVLAADDSEDSFWIRANDGPWVRWNGIEEEDEWSWQLVHDSDEGDETARFRLAAGPNTVEIAYREDGAAIDRFVVTNNMFTNPAAVDASGGPRVDVTFSK